MELNQVLVANDPIAHATTETSYDTTGAEILASGAVVDSTDARFIRIEARDQAVLVKLGSVANGYRVATTTGGLWVPAGGVSIFMLPERKQGDSAKAFIKGYTLTAKVGVHWMR